MIFPKDNQLAALVRSENAVTGSRAHSRLRGWLIGAASVALVACGGGGGGQSAPSPSTPFVATSVENALAHGVDNGLDGIWVFVDDGRGTPEFRAAGIQDRVTLAPADVNSLFKIASISKMFIAVSGARMVAAGLLQLDDTLAFWLPGLATRIENADSITVRHLLLHRSGVPDFDSQPGFSWNDAHTDIDAVLGLALDRPADFAPNARYEYSNTNYLLLGRIFDTALGYDHRLFIQNEILSPLGMVNTYSLLGDTDVALLARGFWDGVDRTEQDYVVPGGSMISTAQEVGIFLRALATGSLLTPNEQQIYQSLFAGFGHSGWLPGYQSNARYLSNLDTVLVQFVNETGGSSEVVAAEVYDSLVDYLGRR
jgi:CubicO group peptidase (beta-lactamase class C family)